MFCLLGVGLYKGDANWWLSLVNTFRYWLFVPLPIFLLDQAFNFRKDQLYMLLFLSAIWGFFYTPLSVLSTVNPEDLIQSVSSLRTKQKGEKKAYAKEFKVMSFNVLAFDANTPNVISFIKKNKPNVLCVQDLTHNKAAALSEIYEYSSFTKNYDIAIFSEFPLRRAYVNKFSGGSLELVGLKIDEKNIYVINLHTSSPEIMDLVDKKDKFQAEYESKKSLGEHISKSLEKLGAENILLTGDFNSTEGNDLYRTLRKNKLKDAYISKNILLPIFLNGMTFPNNLIGVFNSKQRAFPFLRIDYILTGKNFDVLNSQTINSIGSYTGSDHSPVSATLGLI